MMMFKVMAIVGVFIVGLWLGRLTASYGSVPPRELALPNAHNKGLLFSSPKAFDGVTMISAYSKKYPSKGCYFFNNKGERLAEIPGEVCAVSSEGLLMSKNLDLIWLNPSLQEVWRKQGLSIHHDVTISESRKEIFAPTDQPFEVSPGKSVQISGIRGFDFAGKEIFKWETKDHLEELFKLTQTDPNAPPEKKVLNATKINSIHVIDKPVSGDQNIFVPGNLLVSFDLCSCLVVIERSSGDIVWDYKPFPDFRDNIHAVSMTAENEVLYFKNNSRMELKDYGYLFSEVIILDPLTKAVRWSYRAKESGAMYAPWGGYVQELPNGNLLVTSASKVFEITRSQEIVWEWVNTQVDDQGVPLDLFKGIRLSKDVLKPYGFAL